MQSVAFGSRRRCSCRCFPQRPLVRFPQTEEIRKARAAFKKGELTESVYEQFLQACIASDIEYQESVDLDVLVHGEAERNDMVEYFGEQLEGFIATKNGWVQSYGSRCVKPPIIFGDILRKGPMTVKWDEVRAVLYRETDERHADRSGDDSANGRSSAMTSLAVRPASRLVWRFAMKCWTWKLPAFGSFRLTSRRSGKACLCVVPTGARYLKWAVDCFRLSAAGVEDETQIHTHMCYSEFNDIIEAICCLGRRCDFD